MENHLRPTRPRRAARRGAILAFLIGLWAASSGPVQAAELGLSSDHESLAPGTEFRIAVRPQLAAGEVLSFWAGETAGAEIEWELPAGVEPGRANWPRIVRAAAADGPRFHFEPGGAMVQEFTLEEDARADGRLEISLVLAAEVCGPEGCRTERFSGALSIATGPAPTPSPQAQRVDRLDRAAVPFRSRHVSFRAADGVLSLALTLDGFPPDDDLVDVDPGRIAAGLFLPLEAGVLADPGPMALSRNRQGVFGQARLAADFDPGRTISGLFLALDEGGRPIYQRHIAEPSEQARAAGLKDLAILETGAGAGLRFTFVTAALFALLGGLILNIMPCVFPVLALKAFALIKSGGADERAARGEGLAYTAGILVSFLLVGIVIAALRGAGDLVGWGFQLQQPGFVLAMILVLFAVGLNFLGAFEIPARFAGFGGALAGREGASGAFATGVLAAVVATPCTAPFMAPAIAYALGAGTGEGLSVFLFLGLGLALPFLLIAFVPPLRRILPRPGPWMQTAKEFLAFPVFATVIWLVWVLEGATGGAGLIAALAAVLLLGLAAWLGKRAGGSAIRRGAVTLLVLAALAPAALSGRLPQAPARAGAETTEVGGMEVEIYGPDRLEDMQARISDLRMEGRSVFLHFWARWCIICLTHESLVYSTDGFQDFLARNDVVFMMADNTVKDERMVALMQVFGADGQPLDVFFPANGGKEAVVLPKIFTTTSVTDQMQKALAGS